MEFVTDYLEKTAARLPEKTAFWDEKREISFLQLQTEAQRLGTAVSEKGFFDQPVCIYMEKGVEAIASMLGIIYSGNYYTVIDVTMPETRISKILEVLQPAAVVTDAAHREAFQALASESCMDVIIYEDSVKQEENSELLTGIREKMNGESTMFVLFTSGSTGVPKGVIIQHKAFPPYLTWYEEYFHYTDRDVIGNQTPFYYIMSCPDIYLTIKTGATCYIVPKKSFAFPMMVMNFLKEHHVTIMEWVPSILCTIANFRVLPEVHLDDLRLVLFGGEVMPAKQLNMWRAEYPDVRFYNGYGLTETTEVLSWYEITEDLADDQSIPIGKPVDYLKALILDENDKEVPEGETGELCAAGIAIAGGYYNMPEKTAQVFMDNPLFCAGDDPETRRMYRTGDLVKIDGNGDIIYMGRKDFQIKHMGNRIELGEIEMAVNSLDGMELCCCHYDAARKQIVLFYSGNIDEDTVNEKLGGMLPAYMVPNRIERLEKMPFNINGKIDRAALKERI